MTAKAKKMHRQSWAPVLNISENVKQDFLCSIDFDADGIDFDYFPFCLEGYKVADKMDVELLLS
jgi:hypothetical protein